MKKSIWLVITVIAVFFPFLTMIYELLIADMLAAVITAAITLIWIGVLAVAWRAKPGTANEALSEPLPPTTKATTNTNNSRRKQR
jgi:cbb3-type cytochrome oxidase subunit 3